MGVASGSSQLTPMQRLEAIKAVSATPTPELPDEEESAIVVEASFASEVWSTIAVQTKMRAGHQSVPQPCPRRHWQASICRQRTLTLIRSIRVWDVRHYSYRVREREGPCSVRLDMVVGTYDENANFHWSDRAPGPKPDWLPLRKDCPSYFRGVGVEWSDIFGRYDYELVPY